MCASSPSKQHMLTPTLTWVLMFLRRLECASPEEAEGLALRVRRSCAWWGRSGPPHVVIVVNPASGTSRYATRTPNPSLTRSWFTHMSMDRVTYKRFTQKQPPALRGCCARTTSLL